MNIPLSSPDITDLERQYVAAVLDTPNLSLGPLLPKFESGFAEYIGSKYAVAVNSGTSGLHLALKTLEISEGDAVLTTPFSFVASANCILFERARPVFVDVDPVTYNIDTAKMKSAIPDILQRGVRLKAILPVHTFGQPCNMDELLRIAEEFKLPIVEDACEAIGAKYKGKKVGTFGKAAVFAFYPNKQMTTGEGGMIVTDDEKIAGLCRSLRNQGRGQDGGWLAHERLGYNYRLSEINCALGLAQLERIDEMLNKRAVVAAMYREKMKNIEEVHLPCVDAHITMSWFVYVVRLANRYSRQDRDSIIRELRAAGIGCNNYFTPIHLQPFYREMFCFSEGDYPVTEHVAERTIALPFYNNLKEEQIDYIVKHLKLMLRN